MRSHCFFSVTKSEKEKRMKIKTFPTHARRKCTGFPFSFSFSFPLLTLFIRGSPFE